MNRLAIIAVTGALAFMLTACGEENKSTETMKIQKSTTEPKTMDATKPADMTKPADATKPADSAAPDSAAPAPAQ